MDDRQIKLIIGCLLHDIGKVVYRTGDGRNHSESGYDFLKEHNSDFDTEILDCVRYHHGAKLRSAHIADDSLAYIAYLADNVSAATDRRQSDEAEDGFDKSLPLQSVFNILNGNKGKLHYTRAFMNPDADINYPTDSSIGMDSSFYSSVIDNISDNLKGIELNHEYINSLLSVMEANLMYIPSSTSRRELADISLYDHVKLTAAVAEAIYHYTKENKLLNYKALLFDEGLGNIWERDMFMLYSIDLSGIQNFIYTISSSGALRGLRARSFYLELIMEHIIDELLDELELSRACLIYAGGGHCYMLLPNTENVKYILKKYKTKTNVWFMEHFGTDLYMADGYAVCSASALKNEPEGSYSTLYLTVSKQISQNKSNRYTAEHIKMLNRTSRKGERECKICRRTDKLDSEDRCQICAALNHLSSAILYQDYFITMLRASDDALPLPGGRFLLAGDKTELLKDMDSDYYVRSYTKNQMYTGKHVTTKLWVGNYNVKGETFEELAEKAKGIKRIAVLRADVDNLGFTFVNGFKSADGGKYETLSRTATLSRQLSLFFKCYINKILKNGSSAIFYGGSERQLDIVYSGGDDIFLAGAWNDVIDAFIDIKNAFKRFTEGTLTLSGGIGIYNASYPINRMAAETAELENFSKALDGKNAITLFDQRGRYGWDGFVSDVLEDKFINIYNYLGNTDERGKAFLYKLVELLRCETGRFNRAKFVYYLSRLDALSNVYDNDTDKEKERLAFKKFASKMYQWSTNAEERRKIVTAIYLYVYLTRKSEDKTDEDK